MGLIEVSTGAVTDGTGSNEALPVVVLGREDYQPVPPSTNQSGTEPAQPYLPEPVLYADYKAKSAALDLAWYAYREASQACSEARARWTATLELSK